MPDQMKIDKYDWDELVRWLSPDDYAWLEGGATRSGFPPSAWTAIPGLVTMAVTWATVRFAREGELSDASWSKRLDTAEGILTRDAIAEQREYAPNAVRQNIKRWSLGVRDS